MIGSNKTKDNFLWILFLLFFLIITLFISLDLKRELKEKTNLIISLNDTLKVWKDKDSLSHAKIQILETSDLRDFINLKSNNKEIQKLQKLVEKNKNKLDEKSSVTIFEVITKISDKIPTKIDTIYIQKKDSVIKRTIIYYSSFNLGNWVKGFTKITEDSTLIDLSIRNEYSVIIGKESQGWFKSKKSFVEIINENPYSETKSLRTYRVQSKGDKKISVGPFIGYGITNNLQFQPFIGVGIQYSLIKF